MIERTQSPGSASPTGLGDHFSGEEMSMNATINISGMTEFRLRNNVSGKIVTYTALDLRCAQMLAASDHSDDDEDYEAWEWIPA